MMRGPTKGQADRMANIVGLAEVRLVDDGNGEQRLQLELLAEEVLEDIDRHQDYGFASHPLPGATAVTVALGGTRGRSMAIAVGDRRYRLALAAGEVAIHDDQGQKVHLTRDGIVIETTGSVTVTAGELVTVTAPDLTFDIAGAVQFNCGEFGVAAEGALALTGATASIEATGALLIDGASIDLGGTGGQFVARKTDAYAGGVITGGSTKVKST
jgi:phage baseplate assembly protein V